MYSLTLLAVTSFLLALVLTPFVRNLSRRWGVVDRPDAGRKLHGSPIPHLGGVPIVLACAGTFLVLFLSPLHGGDIASQGLPLVWKILPAVGLVFLAGLLDDLRGLRPWQKLVLEVAALLGNNFALAAAVVPLVGALLGFLLGCYGVIWSQKSATLLGMTAPLMVLAIPLLDVCLSIVRRFLRGQPVFQGDRGHVHHRLLDRGLTQRRVVLLLYGVCGLFAGLSLMQTMAAGRRLNEQLEARNGRGTWELRVPLGREDYVVLTREFQLGLQNSVVIPFVETLKTRMGEKEFPRAAGAGN
jgi:UDP-N-acetylmuramyl pentapeptide phosphotransferase/UDP-N-acetylglucosamine-1-phosphate transferase